jgi:predicted amidohydrolase YtcJ
MKSSHTHQHACICSCNNPIVNILEDKIFSEENLAKITAHLPKVKPNAVSPKPMVYSGGTIRPMINGDTSIVEAIGFADGQVIASGNLTDVQAAMDENYKGQYSVTTLQGGQTLLPGLFEPHIHTVFSGIMAAWVDVSPFNGQDLIGVGYTTEYIKGKLTDALKANPGKTLLATGLDPALLYPNGCSNFTGISNVFLDSVSEKVSILVLSASGHTMYANTEALKSTFTFIGNKKLREEYHNSVAEYISTTNGLLQEQTGITPAVLAHWEAVLKTTLPIIKNLDNFFQEANSRGVTSMYDALLSDLYLKILKSYTQLKNLTVRLGGTKYCDSLDSANGLQQYKQPASYSDIYFGHVKIISDGSNQGLTGYQSQAYVCEEDSCGIFNFKGNDFQTLVNEVIVNKGWPIMIHANGDQAVTNTIDAYKTALASYNGTPLRNRIEHCSLPGSDAIDEMVSLDISPSFLIGHVGYWGNAFQNVIFKGQTQDQSPVGPKVNWLDPCLSAVNKGLRISLHSDHTVTPIGPLRMMEQSITRIMESKAAPDNVLNPSEKLSAAQALKAVTYDAAWQCYADKWAGSLTDGHFADFIILASDPLTMPEDQVYMNMRNIKVEQTWLGGVLVYPK